MTPLDRRSFLKSGAALGALAALGAAGLPAAARAAAEPKFKISLATWSLQRSFQKDWTLLDLPKICREQYGIDGLELVNSHFDLPREPYLKDYKQRCEDHGITTVLIMCDDDGDFSHIDKKERMQAAINHRKWIDIAAFLGCHAIRGNARTQTPGTDMEKVARAGESYHALCEYADQAGISVTVENHGDFSSKPECMIALVKAVDHPRFGLLPDFGNFPKGADPYQALDAVMPYAKAVSVKCLDFLPDGTHPAYDLDRMVEIVLKHGYHSWMGIEYSGEPAPTVGIPACKKLLEKHL